MFRFAPPIAAVFAVTLGAIAPGVAADLTIAVSNEEYLPYSKVDTKTNEWTGLEADLTKAVCAAAKADCKFVFMPWDNLLPALEQKKADVAVGTLSITEERRKTVDFSTPYYSEVSTVVGAKADANKIGSVAAPDGSGKIVDPSKLTGKTVAVEKGTVQGDYAAKYFVGAVIKVFDTASDAFVALTKGDVAYVIVPSNSSEVFLKSADGARFTVKIEVPEHKSLGEGLAYAVRKGDTASTTKLNGALSALLKSGQLNKLITQWLFN